MTAEANRSRFEGDDVENDEFNSEDKVPVDDEGALSPIEGMVADTERFLGGPEPEPDET
jgi:hypothetical protein